MNIIVVLKFFLVLNILTCCGNLETNQNNTRHQTAVKSIHSKPTQAAYEINIPDNEVCSLSSENYPEPYLASSSKAVAITAGSTYSILIEIQDLFLDTQDEGDYLLIKAGKSEDDKGEGKVFVYWLNTPRKYFFHSNSVYVKFNVGGSNMHSRPGFNLTYQRIGKEPLTTTESPPTTIPWPTPSPTESNLFVGNIFGKSLQDFTNIENIENFKSAMVDSATDYCNLHKIKLTEEITTSNILLNHIIQCPYSWPNSNLCTQANFSLPIMYEEDSNWKGYLLQSHHLEEIWINYANIYLKQYGMTVYSEPNNRANYIKWIVISCSILAILLTLPCIVNFVGNKFSSQKTMNKDNIDSLSTRDLQNNEFQLWQSHHQSTPQIFEDIDRIDEHDFNIEKPKTTYFDNNYLIYDDVSDDEFTVSQFPHSRSDINKNFYPTNSSDRPTNF